MWKCVLNQYGIRLFSGSKRRVEEEGREAKKLIKALRAVAVNESSLSKYTQQSTKRERERERVGD